MPHKVCSHFSAIRSVVPRPFQKKNSSGLHRHPLLHWRVIECLYLRPHVAEDESVTSRNNLLSASMSGSVRTTSPPACRESSAGFYIWLLNFKLGYLGLVNLSYILPWSPRDTKVTISRKWCNELVFRDLPKFSDIELKWEHVYRNTQVATSRKIVSCVIYQLKSVD